MQSSTGIFVAVAAVWIGSMMAIYKYSQKPQEDASYTKKREDTPSVIENFREPIFPNKKKMQCDNYPRANGSIYGEYSHLMSGYPIAYPKAY